MTIELKEVSAAHLLVFFLGLALFVRAIQARKLHVGIWPAVETVKKSLKRFLES